MYIDFMYIYNIYIYINNIYIYIHIHIKVNYTVKRIHEKAFRSDLSTQIKNTSPLANYLLRITFFCYLLVLVTLFDFPMIFLFFSGHW